MVDIPSTLTDPIGVLPKVSDKMRVLMSIGRRLVATNNPKTVWNIIQDWTILEQQSLGIAKKDFPVFHRVVKEELKKNHPDLPFTDVDDGADIEDTQDKMDSDTELFETPDNKNDDSEEEMVNRPSLSGQKIRKVKRKSDDLDLPKKINRGL